jgi:hypothetical protein
MPGGPSSYLKTAEGAPPREDQGGATGFTSVMVMSA